jgi:D-alanyl-lipoteichoic acid acyltransferase DltB (MBOAT superfamily)
MVTFLLGGLWHGAGWTFVFWGLLHGGALIAYSIWRKLGIRLWRWFAWFLTFNFINISWIFFRAEEWNDAINILAAMFDMQHLFMINPIWLSALLMGFVIVLLFKNSTENLDNFSFQKKEVIYMAFLIVSSLIMMRLIGEQSEFLYFNF